jgi:ribonuclease HI
MNNIIEIYVDGGCHGNSNPTKENSIGAYGYILIYGDRYKEYAQAENNTTSNKQELLASINALRQIKRTDIPLKIYADSKYVISCATIWINSWKKNNWKTADKKPVKNKELIEELDYQLSRFDAVEFIHVKGHSGDKYNERVDSLCTEAIENYKFEHFNV